MGLNIFLRDGLLALAALWVPLAATAATNPVPTPKISPAGNATTDRGSQPPVVYGETLTSRTVFLAISILCISLLTGMLGYRVRQLGRHHLKKLTLTRVLVVVLGCLAMAFVSSAVIVESGLGLATRAVCHVAVFICLAFYVGCKVVMYIFLVERAHALRAPYMKRSRDWIWLGGMLTIAGGFGSIAICGFIWPIAHLSSVDGRCRIGLPFRVTIPLLTFDVVINTLLTGIFIYLLRPLLRFDGTPSEEVFATLWAKSMQRILKRPVGRRANSLDIYRLNDQSFKAIERLLWKSLVGSILVMLPTVGNLGALIPLHGQELGCVCLTICSFDATWSVCVVHWLTLGSVELDGRVVMLTQPPNSESASSATSVPAQQQPGKARHTSNDDMVITPEEDAENSFHSSTTA